MNSVKYNNWQHAVRAHEPAGFNSEAAWEKFQQRNQPRRKKKAWLPWLAAACLCGFVLLLFIIKGSNTNGETVKNNTVPPEENIITKKAATTTINETVTTNHEQPATVQHAAKVAVPVAQPAYVQPPPNPVAVETQNPQKKETLPVIEEHTPPLAAIPPKEEIKTAAKPAMKIVHLNELYVQPMAQQTPPAEQVRPKFPLPGSGYARFDSQEEPPKNERPRKTFGLPRSLASLKD